MAFSHLSHLTILFLLFFIFLFLLLLSLVFLVQPWYPYHHINILCFWYVASWRHGSAKKYLISNKCLWNIKFLLYYYVKFIDYDLSFRMINACFVLLVKCFLWPNFSFDIYGHSLSLIMDFTKSIKGYGISQFIIPNNKNKKK